MILIFDEPNLHLLENVSLCLSSFSNRRPGVRHSTFESLRLGRSSQSIAFGFLRFWDSLNFNKDKEFVGITVLFLDEKIRMFDNCQVIANTNLETGKHSIFGSSKQDYNQENSSGMTYQQLKLLSPKDCIDYGFWEEKDLAPEKKAVTTLLWKLIFLEAPRLQDKSEDICWWNVDQGNTSEK
ncbi:hypothetical protein F2Q69_00010916 [Brassica cretica]|uniref:Uncharacterized protein n=1 Tax=Brassica cretica TaxID=69181 RepID=A0A8S9R9P1_BRACR|nr:hypothetical protein F2Q69_00010916 [Brassica cretica]